MLDFVVSKFHVSRRSTIRDKIIPHAVSWFTGDAVQADPFELEEDLEEEEDDDEDDDDEEDDMDEDEEDEDAPKPIKRKVCMSSFSYFK